MGVDDKPVTADDIDIYVPYETNPAVRDMLRNHEQMGLVQLGEIDISEMRVDLVPDATPFNTYPYRYDPETRELERAENDKQLKSGIIESAISEWAAAVLFVPEKGETLRFYIVYRKLNTITVKDMYHLPQMDECIDRLGDSQYFTTLDACSRDQERRNSYPLKELSNESACL